VVLRGGELAYIEPLRCHDTFLAHEHVDVSISILGCTVAYKALAAAEEEGRGMYFMEMGVCENSPLPDNGASSSGSLRQL